jgi:hypothetical protein
VVQVLQPPQGAAQHVRWQPQFHGHKLPSKIARLSRGAPNNTSDPTAITNPLRTLLDSMGLLPAEPEEIHLFIKTGFVLSCQDAAIR